MAAKPRDIHPAALAELKSAVSWYDERSASAGDGFVAEIDSAIELITASQRAGPVENVAPENLSSHDSPSRLSITRNRPRSKF
jgi:hypothetical protein